MSSPSVKKKIRQMTSFVFVQSCSIFCETGHNKWQCNLQSAFESVCSTLFQICSKKSLFAYNTEMELSEMRYDMTSFQVVSYLATTKAFFQQILLFPLVDRKSILNVVYCKKQPDFGSKTKEMVLKQPYMSHKFSAFCFTKR